MLLFNLLRVKNITTVIVCIFTQSSIYSLPWRFHFGRMNVNKLRLTVERQTCNPEGKGRSSRSGGKKIIVLLYNVVGCILEGSEYLNVAWFSLKTEKQKKDLREPIACEMSRQKLFTKLANSIPCTVVCLLVCCVRAMHAETIWRFNK